MVKSRPRMTILAACATAAALAACSSSDGNPAQPRTCGSPTDGGGVLQSFTAPCTDQGNNAILVTASGETLAFTGYAFPAAPGDITFVDGWAVSFSKVLVTFDHVKLSLNPDKSPTDQSQTDAVVAQADGPWAVNLSKDDPSFVDGKGGAGERAAPITAFTGQNLRGNAAFDPTQRYAFGYEIIPATTSAKNVNLDAADLADYQDMIAKGYTVLLVGTATFQGTGCTQSALYDFAALPPVVSIRFGFASPVTNINCQNPDNDPADPLTGEEHQRGIALRQNQTTVAQVTFHTDHVFWENFVHDSPAHFDQIAAQYVGVPSPTATLEDLASVTNFSTGFTDSNGAALPWRSCVDATVFPLPDGQMRFDPTPVLANPAAQPQDALRNLREAITYGESTMGHLNSDGLCFVTRNYPSPP